MTTATAPVSKTASSTQVKQTKMLIDGKWIDSASGKTFETLNPATGQVIARVAFIRPIGDDHHVRVVPESRAGPRP